MATALPEDFWAEEDASSKAQDAFVLENDLVVDTGAESDTGEDSEDDTGETPVQTDETAQTEEATAETEETHTKEAEAKTDDIDEAVNKLTKRKPM